MYQGERQITTRQFSSVSALRLRCSQLACHLKYGKPNLTYLLHYNAILIKSDSWNNGMILALVAAALDVFQKSFYPNPCNGIGRQSFNTLVQYFRWQSGLCITVAEAALQKYRLPEPQKFQCVHAPLRVKAKFSA